MRGPWGAFLLYPSGIRRRCCGRGWRLCAEERSWLGFGAAWARVVGWGWGGRGGGAVGGAAAEHFFAFSTWGSGVSSKSWT